MRTEIDREDQLEEEPIYQVTNLPPFLKTYEFRFLRSFLEDPKLKSDWLHGWAVSRGNQVRMIELLSTYGYILDGNRIRYISNNI